MPTRAWIKKMGHPGCPSLERAVGAMPKATLAAPFERLGWASRRVRARVTLTAPPRSEVVGAMPKEKKKSEMAESAGQRNTSLHRWRWRLPE